MDATTAFQQVDSAMSQLINGLTPEHREMPTPCAEWNVHELIEHTCEGMHGIAGGLAGQAPPDDSPDLMANGPANAWSEASAHLQQVATPDVLSALHQMPFGEVPGEMALGVIVADATTHAWDLAKATGQEHGLGEELIAFTMATWQQLAPAESRESGGGFGPVLDASADASAADQMAAFTGRQP